MYKFLPVFILFFVFANSASAQVVINEISSSSSPDWIELYAFEDINISNWIIDDYETSSDMKTIPDGIIIGPSSNSFYIVEVSNRLNNGGDAISLLKPDRSEVDKISYGSKGGVCIPSESGSVGRYPDANPTIERFKTSSKDLTNNNIELDSCPSPSPEPTNTPVPTQKPTATPKPNSTSKPTSTTKPISTPGNSPTSKQLVKSATINLNPSETELVNEDQNNPDLKNLALGISDNTATITQTPISENDEEDNKRFPLTAGIFIITGAGFLIASVYPILRSSRIKSKTKGENEN